MEPTPDCRCTASLACSPCRRWARIYADEFGRECQSLTKKGTKCPNHWVIHRPHETQQKKCHLHANRPRVEDPRQTSIFSLLTD